MNSRVSLQEVIRKKETPLLSIFFTAGFPKPESTAEIYLALQDSGVDFVEIGFPFSDPIADGSTIQKTSEQAIKNGMNLEVLFSELRSIKDQISMPIILMGYLNPVLAYGVERFISDCKEVGVQGLILPDLPIDEYDAEWKENLEANGISLIFLVTPQTGDERIREIDKRSTAFIYAVSSQAVTGGSSTASLKSVQESYFMRLKNLNLSHPVIAGFGIHDRESFEFATRYLDGAIIGSAFLRAIENTEDMKSTIREFIKALK